MRISIAGCGYVGLTTGLALAELGNQVVLYDIDREKLESVKGGRSPFYEPDVEELIIKHTGTGALSTMEEMEAAVSGSEVTFIAVGTPSRDDGGMEDRYIISVCEGIGRVLSEKDDFHVVVVKSTVLPGTTSGIVKETLERTSGRRAGMDFGLSMCPEFLREGSAMYDSLNPDRVVIGAEDDRTFDVLSELFGPVGSRVLRVNATTAEMIKYSSNSLLATKISFANEVSRICENVGVDVYKVMEGVGMDHRISPHFLRAGVGFGGSCFPKDVSAVRYMAGRMGLRTPLLDGVMENNEIQPKHLLDVAERMVGPLKGSRVSVLGLSFKPDTDDIRETRSLPVILGLIERGAEVGAHDPQAQENFRRVVPDIKYFNGPQEAVDWGDAVILMTEWPQFRGLMWKSNAHLKGVIDGRRTVSRDELGDIDYWSIGMPLPRKR